MTNLSPANTPQANNGAALLEAFRAYVRHQRLVNTRVGCLLVIFLMPAGSLLDYFVYEDELWPFFFLRLAASVAAGSVLAFLFTGIGQRSGRWLGVIVPLNPRLLDMLRHPDEAIDRPDLQLAQG